jgi:hypothetical protein
MLLVTLVARAAGAERTWTFSEDGIMRCPSGGQWSFKKKGSIDAAFVRMEGTNVTVMCTADGKERVIPAASLSDDDRAYLKGANGVPEWEAATISQAAAAKSAEARRAADVGQLKTQAASKRNLARLDIEEALRLENEARRLGTRAGSLEFQADHHARVADRMESSGVIPPKASLTYIGAKLSQSRKTDAADQVEKDLVRVGQEAGDKRAAAARLEQEAAELEATARSMERGVQPLGAPVSR